MHSGREKNWILRIPNLALIYFISKSTHILIRSKAQKILLSCQTELETFSVIFKELGDFHTGRRALITVSSAP